MSITEILQAYTKGELELNEANRQLSLEGAGLQLDPNRNRITESEQETHGLLDTGTGSLDKVEIRDMHMVDTDVGDMYALCIFNGKTYRVRGAELTEG